MSNVAGTLVPREARDFGGYELIAKIATGGMAEIYLARAQGSTGRGQGLVIKRILPHLAEDDHFVTMFRDEASLAQRLIHPNVCRVHALGHHQQTWFIAMEYLHGVALSRMMSRLSKKASFIDYRIIAGMLCQAAEGLHHAHELREADGSFAGVVHRDVSPPNIMLVESGLIKVLDFGIAKARGANSKTRTGTVKGKNAYMSPEQILGKPLDRRSDVFALGAVMYELVAIKRLFHRDSDFLTFKAITEEPIPDLRARRADVPEAMVKLLEKALARDPADRWATAKEFADALRDSVAALGGPASQVELQQFLSREFGDELASRDELLKLADDPAAAAAAGFAVAAPPMAARRPSTIPPPRDRALPAVGGEVSARPLPGRAQEAVPSMIVHSPSGALALPRGPGGTPPALPVRNTGSHANRAPVQPPRSPTPMAVPVVRVPTPAPLGTPTQPYARDGMSSGPAEAAAFAPTAPSLASVSVPANAAGSAPIAMASAANTQPFIAASNSTNFDEPHTDLLSGHRRKTLIKLGVAAVVIAGIIVGIKVLAGGSGKTQVAQAPGVTPRHDAAPIDAPSTTPDARDTTDDMVAFAKYGFLSIDANAETQIYVDNVLVGPTPLTRVPMRPGPKKIKAVGPRNKVKKFDVILYGGKDTDVLPIVW